MDNKTMIRIERFAFGVAAVLTVTTAAVTAQASGNGTTITSAVIGVQEGFAGPPPPPGRGPGRNGGPGGPGGPRRMPPPISAATIPVDMMTTYLELTATQVNKIREINAALRDEMRPPRPPHQDGPQGNAGGDQRPQPPSPEEREARSKVMDAAIQKASTSVIALLDEQQKPRLITLLRAFDALRAGRIPPPALRDLRLTESQWTQLAALGKGATHETIRALLTDAQKSALESQRPGPDGQGPPPHDGPPRHGGFGPGGPPPDGI